MRIKLTMFSKEKQAININYNYYLSSLIYNLLQQSSSEYSSFLHSKGYEHKSKKYKMFTFSRLFPEKYKIQGTNIIVQGNITWYITSPMKDFLMYFANTITTNSTIQIGKAIFQVINVEATMEPEFKSNMKFYCLSPITVSTAYLNENSKLKQVMLYIEDKQFTKNLKNNAISKYELLNGHKPQNTDFNINFLDIEKYKKGKLINYKDNIKIKGYIAPFEFQGNPELIKVAYECGLGDKNSQGMGMIEIFERR